MSEETRTPEEIAAAGANPEVDDAEIVEEVKQIVGNEPKTQHERVEAALIAAKRELRAANRKVKELEPVAASAKEIGGQLERAQPIINAVLANPKLLAEAARIAKGTRTSNDGTVQPSETEDPDAAAYAEDAGFYLSDNQTPDVARARRVLDRLDARHGRQTREIVSPIAGTVLGSRAETNLQSMMRMTDDEGVPLATPESIREVASKLPSNLLANPEVADLVLNSAIGLDRRNKRSPKAPDEPLFLDRPGGGRGRRESAVDADLSAAFARLGIDEKQGAAAVSRLEQSVSGNRRGGVALGVK
jgi:hypothetical protein